MVFPASSIGNQFPTTGFVSNVDLHNKIDVPLDGLRGYLLQPALAQLSATATQSIPNGAFTALLFDTEEADSVGGHSTSSNTSRYVCQQAGIYYVSGGVTYVTNSTANRAVEIAKNGTAIGYSTTDVPAAAAAATQISTVPVLVTLAVNDFLEVMTLQASGGALSTVSGASGMTVLKVSI